MNVLFVFYVPSGGMDTLNRLRCKALKKYGIHASCLYYYWGAGVQNNDEIPMYITNNDDEIRGILAAGNYDVIVVPRIIPASRDSGRSDIKASSCLKFRAMAPRKMPESSWWMRYRSSTHTRTDC
ncbi:hypothetical protein [Paenibacillus chibensis]|uniref:hypothetical protein n=1 Tax=Paenibacillus chibensis TaxID=59846 RepID=UPI0027D83C4E|nr:hypothetical protein [Paenibacillus chibensis]